MFTAVVRVTGAGRLADFRERLRWLMVRDPEAEDYTEHHAEGVLEYRFRPRKGIPFPAFAEASGEFPELRVEAQWEHDGVHGRAVIENGKVEELQDAQGAPGVEIAVEDDGRLELAMVVERRDDCCIGYAASADRPVPDYAASLCRGVKGVRIGVPTNYFYSGATEEVDRAVREAVKTLAGLGATVEEVDIPNVEHAATAALLMYLVEATAYHDDWLNDKSALFTDQVRTYLELGNFVLAKDYVHALRYRTYLGEKVADAFEKCFQIWQASTMVTNVLGTGPVPSFAPPYVPVGPVVMGTGTMTPGGFV